MSCGTGIRDGEGDLYVTKTIGPEGGRIVLQEATLDVWPHCLNESEAITMRRFATIDHAGAVGPVFEIQIPTPDIFQLDPQIGIVTSDVAAGNPASKIGFLVPGAPNEQWAPDTSLPYQPCSSPTVCGPVQSDGFPNPGGAGSGFPPTTKLDFAIVTQCGSNPDCAGRQTCSSHACQQCYEVSSCNPPS
jgi:hypothetical protein